MPTFPPVCISCNCMLGDKILIYEKLKKIRISEFIGNNGELTMDESFNFDIDIPTQDILNELKLWKPCCRKTLITRIQAP